MLNKADMKKAIERLEQQKKQVQSKITKLNQKIKFLLEEPRGEVAGILNESYEEKYGLLRKVEDLDKQIKNLLSRKYIEQLSTFNVKVDGQQKKLYIVEDNMVDPRQGFISSRSLLASMLMDKTVGDTFTLKTPRGDKNYTVLKSN